MAPGRVVVADPGLDLEAGFKGVGEGPASLQDFAFECGVERLCQGVVGRGADSGPGLEHAEFLAGFRELLGNVLRAVIGVEDRTGQRAANVVRAAQRGLDQVGALMVGDRPPDQTARVQVDDGREVEELAALQRQVRDITDVAPIRLGRGEVTPDSVGHDLMGRIGRGSMPTLAQPDSCDAGDAHQAGDPLAVDLLAGRSQLDGDPGRAIDASAGPMSGLDPRGRRRVRGGLGRPGRGPVLPLVVALPRDAERLAQPLHTERGFGPDSVNRL